MDIDPNQVSVSVLHKKIVNEFRNSCLDVNDEVPTKNEIRRKLNRLMNTST